MPETTSHVTSASYDGKDFRAHKIWPLRLGDGAASGPGQSVYTHSSFPQ